MDELTTNLTILPPGISTRVFRLCCNCSAELDLGLFSGIALLCEYTFVYFCWELER